MSFAGWPLQVAVFQTLTPALAPVPVYDAVPDGAAFPYVVIGDDVAVDASYVAREGEDIELTLHVWSRYDGRREVKELMGKVKTALHGRRLAVPGTRSTPLRFTFETTFTEPDGRTRHGVIRFAARLLRACPPPVRSGRAFSTHEDTTP